MISSIVLAAGRSERMGDCKQLLKIGDQTMVSKVISTLSYSTVDEIVAVIGCKADDVKREISEQGVKIVYNPDYDLGMSTSLKVGVDNVDDSTEAVLIVLADQPLLEVDTINKLVEVYRESKAPLVAPFYRGKRGNPVLIDLDLKSEIMNISGDKGARDILNHNRDKLRAVSVNTPSVLMDIDTKEDLNQVRKVIEES